MGKRKLQASARHPFGEAETGQRAGERHKKPWPVSTPGASLIAPQPCAAEGGGSFAAPTGQALSLDDLPIQDGPYKCPRIGA